MTKAVRTAKRSPWVAILLQSLRTELGDDPFWSRIAEQKNDDSSRFGIHIAVLVEPYLERILEGKKTVESRFSINRSPPYGYVREGDLIFLKRVGGPICAITRLGQIWFYKLDPRSWKSIRTEHAAALCIQDQSFWKSREKASYATLMQLAAVRRITPVTIPKKDRRGWVVIRESTRQQGTLFT